VPIIAAAGGVLFSQEAITWRLFIASLCVLGGILLVILGRKYIPRIN
jgi:drug/metabolite transporter (DMT)-like permease